MATAVEPSSAPSAPGKPLSLPIASLLGAIYVVLALAVVFRAVPVLWQEQLAGSFGTNAMTSGFSRLAVQFAAMLGLVWFGLKLSGATAPKGMRAGAFLMIAWALVTVVIVRALALSFDTEVGQGISIALGIGLVYLAVRFFTGHTGERWMVGLEEQGWFSTAQYKKSLGQRVRRLTTLGILLIGGSGIYSVIYQGLLPTDLTLTMPFGLSPVTVIESANFVIPLLGGLATLWVAWRAVNVPNFAEFLIATEAEMNKVSWSTRKRLMQDTVVVLLTTLIMTLFLLVVDLFWGWLLSRQTVGVLPGRSTSPDQKAKVREAKW
jgi:preprotein translocase SecE subunit